MRLIRYGLVLLVALWLIGELLLIPFAERQTAREVAARTRDTAAVSADIGSFPLAARVLFTGKVPRLSVTLDRVARASVRFAEVRFDLEGISVDRPAMLRGRAQVESIDRGTVTATIEIGALGRLASLAGIDVRVVGRTLNAGRVSVAIAEDLVPCNPEASVDGERVILTCAIDDVPDVLVDALQRS